MRGDVATDPFLIAVFFGFVPGMGFLYILLHAYNQFFSEKRIFRVFMFGLAFGLILTLLELYLVPIPSIALSTAPTAPNLLKITLFAFLLGLLEAMAFAAYLNWKTFRGRRDTPYYGVAFGVGFGATKAIVSVNFFSLAFQGTNNAFFDVAVICLFGILVIGDILRAGTVGAWIGQGSANKDLRRPLARGTLVSMLYALFLYGYFALEFGPALAFVSLGLGLWLVSRRLLPLLDRVVPPEILREMDIHQRRIARKVHREDEPPGP